MLYIQTFEDSKTDSQKMWSALKKVLPNNVTQHEIPTVVYNSKMYTNAKDFTSILNKYFSSIDHTLSKVFGRVRKIVLPQIFAELKPVSTDFVLEQLRGLNKANEAIDLDKISARLSNDASHVISPMLTNLINVAIYWTILLS